MGQFHFLAVALIVFVAYIRISSGPNKEAAALHKFEVRTFSNFVRQLESYEQIVSKIPARLREAEQLVHFSGIFLLLALVLEARTGERVGFCLVCFSSKKKEKELGSLLFLKLLLPRHSRSKVWSLQRVCHWRCCLSCWAHSARLQLW